MASAVEILRSSSITSIFFALGFILCFWVLAGLRFFGWFEWRFLQAKMIAGPDNRVRGAEDRPDRFAGLKNRTRLRQERERRKFHGLFHEIAARVRGMNDDRNRSPVVPDF